MDKTLYSPTTTSAWKKLTGLAGQLKSSNNTTIESFFEQDKARAQKYSLQVGELLLDFSKNLISDDVWLHLVELAKQSPLASHRTAMFTGEAINRTENRSVLHTVLRANPEDAETAPALLRSKQVSEQLSRVKEVSDQIRNGSWLGSTGKVITDVVNIGIGGSDLGPKLACTALEEYAHDRINLHFISNVDGAQILTTLNKLNPETTLVSIASKTFTTQETMLNAQTAINWYRDKLGLPEAQKSCHFLGLTANHSSMGPLLQY